jgi:UDPglucose--hexose-1-phosphate uridylyltransferase
MFKNRGPRSGASLHHAHGQVMSLPVSPSGVRRRDGISRRHHAAHGRGALAEARDRELAAEVRVVEQTARYAVFCPFAPHRSYETWIVPMAPSPSLARLDDEGLDELAPLVGRTLRRVLAATEGADYNLVLRAPALRNWGAPRASNSRRRCSACSPRPKRARAPSARCNRSPRRVLSTLQNRCAGHGAGVGSDACAR